MKEVALAKYEFRTTNKNISARHATEYILESAEKKLSDAFDVVNRVTSSKIVQNSQ